MPQFAIIIPTLNEVENISPLLANIRESMGDDASWEVIFVDDNSEDGTWQQVFALAQEDARIRCLRRIGRRGLASACIEGMLATSAPYLAVMDADLQHDASILPQLFAALTSGEATVAVGSRYVAGGGVGNWDATRTGMSRFATRLASSSLLAPCQDPMSGYFAVRRDIIDSVAEKISLNGFKILFDILSMPGIPLKVKEIPYVFSTRMHGHTKLSPSVIFDFAWLLTKKWCSSVPIANFLVFCLVGLTGVLVHYGVLYLLLRSQNFVLAQTIATYAAMTSNYFLNNIVTFSSYRLSGVKKAKGYIKFCLICSFGAVINIACAHLCFSMGMAWFAAAGIGIVAGSILNYIFSRHFIWK